MMDCPLSRRMIMQFYMVSALIKGTESYCCEECLQTVITAGVKIQFQPWESPNGTNESRGQVSHA